MSTTIGCQTPGASQPKEPVRLIDESNVMEAVFGAVELDDSQYLAIQHEIEKLPTIDPESLRPTAHWIKRGYVCGENEYECSACHQTEWRTSASRMKYCMFCGARMVNEDESL